MWRSGSTPFVRNIDFDTSGRPLDLGGKSFGEWQKLGMDSDRMNADPLFVDPQQY